MNERASQPPRLLVIKLSSLGDLFHALPAVRMLRRGLGMEVDWVTQPAYVELVRCFADVRRVIAFPRRNFLSGFPAFRRALRQERYDLAVDLQGLLKSALVACLARAARRIGPSFHREGARLLYDAVAGPRDKHRHAVAETCDVVRFLGLPVGAPEFPVSFPRHPLAAPAPRVALLPCSRWPTKNWPPEHFVAVGRALRARAGGTLHLFGAPEDAAVCGAIARGIGDGAVDLCGRTGFVELGGWLQEMDLVISVDSGPMHMAAALGRPVLAVFGPTDPRRTGPYGPQHRVLTADGLECRPCLADFCRREDLACQRWVAPERVTEAALEMLGKR